MGARTAEAGFTDFFDSFENREAAWANTAKVEDYVNLFLAQEGRPDIGVLDSTDDGDDLVLG